MTAIIKPRHGTIESRVEEQGATIRYPRGFRVDRFSPSSSRTFSLAPEKKRKKKKKKKKKKKEKFL